MKRIRRVPQTSLAIEIQRGLNDSGLSIRELAEDVGYGYETLKAIVAGKKPPSSRFLKSICDCLSLDFQRLNEIVVDMEIRRRYKVLPKTLTDKNPELRPIEDLWPFLDDYQKEEIISTVRMFADRGWKKEVERRRQELLSGKVKTIPWEEVRNKWKTKSARS
jgi:transcriptional regulator with XRE-family HTH domain